MRRCFIAWYSLTTLSFLLPPSVPAPALASCSAPAATPCAKGGARSVKVVMLMLPAPAAVLQVPGQAWASAARGTLQAQRPAQR
eukprot:SAG22_NODE_2628_length_2360_cov_1.812030_4_plen_84_part_00